jgi:hypothetical protein
LFFYLLFPIEHHHQFCFWCFSFLNNIFKPFTPSQRIDCKYFTRLIVTDLGQSITDLDVNCNGFRTKHIKFRTNYTIFRRSVTDLELKSFFVSLVLKKCRSGETASMTKNQHQELQEKHKEHKDCLPVNF